MKKITFILPSLAGGGAERIILNVYNHIELNDFEKELIVISTEGEYLTLLQNAKYIDFGLSGKNKFVQLLFFIPKFLEYVWKKNRI